MSWELGRVVYLCVCTQLKYSILFHANWMVIQLGT
jgi:hypothetical protein